MILMNDFKAEPAEIREAMTRAAQRVFESGWYVLGKELEAFEQLWAQSCGVPYAIGVGNGLDAIEIALRALSIGPGDEVITTPMTAFASVLAIIRSGATPVLADIDPGSGLLSPESVEHCITPRTRAVLVVHLYGQLRQMDTWLALCQRHQIELIEDCAQAHLASSNGRVAGSFGSAGAYSFYPTKNLGAIGDAGMVITSNPALAEEAKSLRNYGQSQRYYHPKLGMNSRLDELQAAILIERHKWLTEFTTRRQAIASIYRTQINNPHITLLDAPESNESHVYHLFVISCVQRDALQTHLHNSGVQALIHYPVPVHFQEPCRAIQRAPSGLTHAEQHAQHCLSLPCHPQLTDSELEQVISAVNRFASD